MFDHRSPGIWILPWLGIAAATPASADGPRPVLKLKADATVISPDQTLRMEQYFNDLGDRGIHREQRQGRPGAFLVTAMTPRWLDRSSIGQVLLSRRTVRTIPAVFGQPEAARKARKKLASSGKISMLQPETASLALGTSMS
jgi:hypothetical protein